MTRYSTRAQWTFLMTVTALSVYLCWRIFEPFVDVILWATVAVIVFYPVHQWLVRKTGKPNLAALITIFGIIVVIALPLAGVSALLVSEVKTATVSVQNGIEVIAKDPHWGPQIKEYIARIQKHINVSQMLDQSSKLVVSRTASVLGGAFGFILNICFTIFTMFFLFRDGHLIVQGLSGFMPLDARRTQKMLDQARDIINASVYGVLVIAAIQGCLGGLMFWILGIQAPLVWTVVMILLSTIPMIGSFVVWGPAAIYLAVTGQWWKAGILTFWGGAVIGMADNLLRPRLVGKRTRMHELLVFFSVLGGLQVFGALGILMGPVTMGVTVALLDALRETSDQA